MIYKILLVIHIVTAIIGMGNTFMFPFLLKLPKTGQQVKMIQRIIEIEGKVAKNSDYILLLSGVGMIAYTGVWFSQGWLTLSLILFICMRLSSAVLSKKTVTELWEVMNSVKDDSFPKDYHLKVKSFMPRLITTQLFVFVIIIIMILKPSIPFLSL